MEQRQTSQQMELEQLDISKKRKDPRHRAYTLYKSNSLWITAYVNDKATQFREYSVREN